MTCRYCRGEDPLFGSNAEGIPFAGDAWSAKIEPFSGELVIGFDDGGSSGELELEIKHCPMCGASLAEARRSKEKHTGKMIITAGKLRMLRRPFHQRSI